jgi:hypothetical protein
MLDAGIPPEQIVQELRETAANAAGTSASPFSSATQKTMSSPLSAGFDAFKADPSKFMTKENLKYGLAGLSPVMAEMMKPKTATPRPVDKPYEYSFNYGRRENPNEGYTGAYTGERTYFDPRFVRTAAGGGLMDIGPIEAMSNRNQDETLMANGGQMFAEGGETKAVKPVEQDPYYTMSGQSGDAFKYLMGQMPAPSRAPASSPAVSAPVRPTMQVAPTEKTIPSVMGGLGSLLGSGSQPDATMRPYTFDPMTGTFTAMPVVDQNAVDVGMADGGIASLAQGGASHLGDYSDGGRLLKGPGDGVSDSIPASIGDKRPARLADGEFVVPARIVSELGNGSTEAGARKLYAMMDRVQNARKKSIGKDRVAVNSRAEKMLPA